VPGIPAAKVSSIRHRVPTRSRSRTTTKRKRSGAKADFEALGISIHDHLVIGRKGHASFRSLGLL